MWGRRIAIGAVLAIGALGVATAAQASFLESGWIIGVCPQDNGIPVGCTGIGQAQFGGSSGVGESTFVEAADLVGVRQGSGGIPPSGIRYTTLYSPVADVGQMVTYDGDTTLSQDTGFDGLVPVGQHVDYTTGTCVFRIDEPGIVPQTDVPCPAGTQLPEIPTLLPFGPPPLGVVPPRTCPSGTSCF